MKSTILILFAFVFTLSSFAQVPQKFNYQAVVRNNTGVIITNQNISVKAEILDSNINSVLYSETHAVTTNAQGLFSLQVGSGIVKSGLFVNIDWSAGNRYIRTSVDLTGGTNYQLMGTSQLLSVPYALYSKEVTVKVSVSGDTVQIGNKKIIIPGTSNANPVIDSLYPKEGLVAFYPFSGNANDASGNGNDGTVNGATLSSDRFGKSNSAYNFDGISNYINTPYQETNLTSFSVSAWVKTTLNYTGGGPSHSIIQNRGTNGKAIALTYNNNGNWTFNLDGDHTGVGQFIPYQNNNQWLHVTGTWQSSGTAVICSDFKFYINGILQSNTGSNCEQYGSGTSPITGSGTMKIAFHEVWNSYFKGDLDEIRIYNRALKQDEITYLASH
jgi:hypothetical protein